MALIDIAEDVRRLAKEAKANHSLSGFEEPAHVTDALSRIADALEEISSKLDETA